MGLLIFCLFVAGTALACTAHSVAAAEYSNEMTNERIRELIRQLEEIKNSLQPRNCHDLWKTGQRTSGVYRIFHKAAGTSGQPVYCDMDTDGGGWTVIQRRGQYGNNAYYFYRNWAEYAEGFGVPDKEYWIGNRALHALTSGEDKMAFRVVLTNNTRDQQIIYYESVKIYDEESLFRMELGKFLGPSGWDAMRNCSGMKFSTYDRDNDLGRNEHCAVRYRGGWWYNWCHFANLNGLNLNGPHTSYADGIEWALRGDRRWHYYYSYPSVQMMIRPVGFGR